MDALDRADGQRDGRWGDDDIAQLLQGWDTPARIPYQTRVIEELIRRERFGADATPDLLFVNYKVTDYVAHTWGVGSPEMRDSLQAQDAALAELVRYLDERVGAGRWAMVLTADHGAAPSPSETGGTVISSAKLTAAIEARRLRRVGGGSGAGDGDLPRHRCAGRERPYRAPRSRGSSPV